MQLAAAMTPVHAGATGASQSAATAPGAVQPATYVESAAANPTVSPREATSLAARQPQADRRGDPPERVATIRIAQSPAAPSSVRFVAPSGAGANASNAQATLRMTVGEPTPAPAADASGARVAIVGGAVPAAATSPTQTPATVTRTAAFQTVAPSAAEYAHAPDYRTLRGQLEYSQSLRQWKLRYIPIDGPTDSYGGSVILADSPALASFQPGDLVAVRGALAAAGAASGGFSPRYQLEAIAPQAR